MADPLDYSALATQARSTVDYGALADQARKPESGPVGRFFSNAWNQLNPLPALKTVMDVYNGGPGSLAAAEAFHGIIQSHADQIDKAKAAWQKGQHVEAAGHMLGAMVPLIGPAAANAGEQIGGSDASYDKFGNVTTPAKAPDLAGGLGSAAGLLTGVSAPAVISKVRGVGLPKMTNTNPLEAAAMSYVEGEGVPVSAAARSGNPYVRGVQKMADTTPLGAVIASRAERATTEGLRDLSGRLAERADPLPTVPEQAGADVRTALERKAAGHGADANANYALFRSAENDPANLREVQTGTKTIPETPHTGLDANGQPTGGTPAQTVPVMEKIPMATDVRPIKAQLAPIVENMKQWWEPARRNASAGFTSAQSILNGPDYVPASIAEQGLSGLKELAREGDPRNAGIAKSIIPNLQKVIDGSAAQAGPGILDSLQEGRAATAAQYGVKAVIQQLRDEPVQTFNGLTFAKDSSIDKLRQVAAQVPGELPKVGRAYLEDLFGQATAQGAFDRTQGLWQKWQNLGPETKKLLFQNPALIGDLDKFFLAAKKIAENPNPSGSGIVSFIAGQGVLAVTHPMTGIPMVLGAGAVSKLMHSPAGVRALTNGLTIPIGNRGAAAMAAAQILNLAGKDARPLAEVQAFPQAAQSNDPSQQNAPTTTAALR